VHAFVQVTSTTLPCIAGSHTSPCHSRAGGSLYLKPLPDLVHLYTSSTKLYCSVANLLCAASTENELDEPVPDALIDSSPNPSPRLTTPSNCTSTKQHIRLLAPLIVDVTNC
jgi:hypothetical protein